MGEVRIRISATPETCRYAFRYVGIEPPLNAEQGKAVREAGIPIRTYFYGGTRENPKVHSSISYGEWGMSPESLAELDSQIVSTVGRIAEALRGVGDTVHADTYFHSMN